jgi:hypothetical protein
MGFIFLEEAELKVGDIMTMSAAGAVELFTGPARLIWSW